MSTRLARYEEVREHRILHKVKKNWVILSVASFALMGAAASLPQTSQLFSNNTIVAHADDTYNYYINANSYPADGVYDENNTGGIPSVLFTLHFPLDVTVNVDGQQYQHINKDAILHRKAVVKTENGVKKVYWSAYAQDDTDSNVINNVVNNDPSTTWGNEQAKAHLGGYSWLNGIVYQLGLTSSQVSFDSTTAQTTMNGQPLTTANGQTYNNGSELEGDHYFFNSNVIYGDNLYTDTPFLNIDGNQIINHLVDNSSVNVYGSSWLGVGATDQFTINYKSKTQMTTQHKTVKRTVNYQDADGKTISGQNPTVQTVSYHRDVTTNDFTGQVTKGDWVADDASQSELAAVTVPEKIDNRYTNPKVNGQAVSSIAAEKPTLSDDENEQDETVNVLYTDNGSDSSNGGNNTPSNNGSNNTPAASASNADNHSATNQTKQHSSSNSQPAAKQAASALALPNTGQQAKTFGIALTVSAGLATLAFLVTKKHD
ncbi:hypothetical protein LNP00_05520 [Fructobacillus sp. M158]|uniref:mucin-binding protein n=1 Tax=Fructobacillus parabroussonetiae TaxID=2713174 RepID=UPI00200AC63C|nr:hypothetical protein [Fructobacillus parabroussonetiae]MCK8617814.1 hypothetical protein [Fructobacillus parabroussonetiae]